jgi:hypothetical protein
MLMQQTQRTLLTFYACLFSMETNEFPATPSRESQLMSTNYVVMIEEALLAIEQVYQKLAQGH